jgi:hypothetical protein
VPTAASVLVFRTAAGLDGVTSAGRETTISWRMIAPEGQTSRQVPQLLQRSWSMRATLLTILIACSGQTSTHNAQPSHLDWLTASMIYFLS